MNTRRFVLLLLIGLPGLAQAQPDVLTAYVVEGLQQNLALHQHTLDYTRSQYALAEARRMFLPSLDFSGRYTRAGGGRTIEFPVGDLLNPVYATLNDLLAAQGQPGGFPTLENEQIPFLRTREQETRVRVMQPVFQPALRHNVRLQSSLMGAQEASLEAYKRQLVADIKTAYFNYLKADQVIDIYEATDALVTENVRVNDRLFANGKVTQDAVFRAQAEAQTVVQELANARKNRDLAASYFNFLLNRPLDAPIEAIDTEALLPAVPAARAVPVVQYSEVPNAQADLTAQALDRREELTQLSFAIDAAEANRLIEQSAWLPGVSLVLDYGIQGESYRLTEDADFWMASVVVNWNLFDGFRKRRRSQQATLERRKLEAERLELERRIQLQVQEAVDNVTVARRSIDTARDRLLSARQSFRLVSRKYDEGMANLVEFVDARTTLTNAELNLALTEYDLLICYTELERAAGLYPM